MTNVIPIEINNLDFVDIESTFYNMQAQENMRLYLL